MADGPVEGWVEAADGVRIAYRDHGGVGRGLVLVHGGGANLESMDQFADRLGHSRRTVAIDVRCCGQSDDVSHFRLADAASDITALVEALDLGPIDVVGHSMGGFVGGYYGTANPSARVVSIDGFGPGMVTVGTDRDHAEFRDFQDGMRAAFFAMTAPPEVGDAEWRDQQVELLCEVFPRIGYTAPNGRAMAQRSFVALGDGSYQRRPPRHLFADAFADDGELDVLRMYRYTAAPTLIIRCTRSGVPDVLDVELDELTGANEAVHVLRLPLTHLAPAWDAIDDVVAVVNSFLDGPVPAVDSS